MSDASKYLMQTTATIVAAKIAARAGSASSADSSGDDAATPDLETEFFDTYRAIERALSRLGVDRKPKGFNPNDDEPSADVQRSV